MAKKVNELDNSEPKVTGKRRGPKRKPPRPIQREEFLAALDLSRHYRQDLLKEVLISYDNARHGVRDQGEMRRAEFLQVKRSVYYYWWLFVQHGAKFRSPERDPARDSDVAKTLSTFGDLRLSFGVWWAQIGRQMFSEQGDLPLIKIEAMDDTFDFRDPKQFPKHITVKIPLTIPVVGIQHQLGKILEICHPGNALKVHESSSADVKIYPQRDAQIDKLSRYIRVWRAVEKEKRDIPDPSQRRTYWQIGRDLGLAQNVDLDGDDMDSTVNRTNLQTDIRRIYEKANRLVDNALRGKFPKAS